MRFDDAQLALIRQHLLGESSADLIRFMQFKSLGRDLSGFSEEIPRQARNLGWFATPSGALSELGFCAADSCREYQFWLERGKLLPFEGAAPHLSASAFTGRSVLEIGCGMGANLMSLAAAGAEVCGVEPLEAYAQLGTILCAREGIAPPDVRQGMAEALPFADDSADLILCVSAHQYFDLRPAFSEIARVLRSGGELIVIGGTLSAYLPGALRELLRRPERAKGFAITVINTLSYMAIGRRIVLSRSGSTTSRPVYPTRSAMWRFLREAGLAEIPPTIRVVPETCFHAQKLMPQLSRTVTGSAHREYHH